MAGPSGTLFACLSDVYAVLQPDDVTELHVPVEAWDGTGAAWVVGDRSLIQADSLDGFVGVTSTGQLRARGAKVKPPDKHGRHVPPGQAS